MNDVDEAYGAILEENKVKSGSHHYKKYLKKLMEENIPSVEFVKPPRVNESERVVWKGPLETEVVCTEKDEFENVKILSEAATILRSEIANMKNWLFEGSLDGFDPPQKLTSFIKWLLVGDRSDGVAGKRENTVKTSVDVVCQLILNSFKSNRQMAYKPASDQVSFRRTVETPLSVGLSLAIHKQTRSKRLVELASHLGLSLPYSDTIKNENRMVTAVKKRMVQSGGYCLPLFVKKDRSLFLPPITLIFWNTRRMDKTLFMEQY